MNKLSFSLHEIEWKIKESLLTFKEVVDLSNLAKEDTNDIRRMDNVAVEGFFSEDGKDILCHLNIKCEIILPCARTLVDVPYQLDIKADEVFSETNEHEDDEVNLILGETIDLMPYVREHILLNIPYRVFSETAEVETGKDWTFQLEDEAVKAKENKVDPRLQKLQELLNDNED